MVTLKKHKICCCLHAISFINICILSSINQYDFFFKQFTKIKLKVVQQLILLTSCSWSCVKEGNLDSKDNNSVCRLHLMESSDTSDNNLMYRSTPCRGEKRYLLRLRFHSQLYKMICREKNSHRICTSTNSPSLMCRWTSFFVISIFLSLPLSKKDRNSRISITYLKKTTLSSIW